MVFKKRMDCWEFDAVAVETFYLCPVNSILDCITDKYRVRFSAAVIVAERTVVLVQGVNVRLTCQGTGARLTEYRSITGMAVGTQEINSSVIVSCFTVML